MMTFSSQIAFSDYLAIPDLAVFFGILFLTFLVTCWGNLRKKKTVSENSMLDYLLMGRRLTLPFFTITLVATWYGGIFGVAEISYESGIYNFVTQGAFWYVTYLVFAFFLVKKLRSFDAVTLPELAGKLFGPRSQKVAGVFNFFNILPVAYVMSIGLFIQMIFGGKLLYATILGTVLVALYSLWGGLRSVVFADIVQFFVMCLAVFFVVIFAADRVGGWDYLKLNLPVSHFDLTGGHTWMETLVWGFIAFETLVDPSFYQRCLAADSDRTARFGIVLSTLVWFGFDICTTLGGMYARAALPSADPKQAYMIFAMQVLPEGLRGFFLAGVLATILSTLDAFLLVASNTLSYDLAPHRFKKSMGTAHLSTFVAAGVAILLSFYFDGSVKTSWKILGSYAAGSLLIPMLCGLIKKNYLSDNAFVLATVSGAVAITGWRLTERTGFWANVDDLYAGMLTTAMVIMMCRIFTSSGPRKIGR